MAAAARDAALPMRRVYDSILIMATTTAVAPLARQQPTPDWRDRVRQGATFTQLRPVRPAPLAPGMLTEPPNPADQMDDPAIAAAAAAGLVPVPAFNPGQHRLPRR